MRPQIPTRDTVMAQAGCKSYALLGREINVTSKVADIPNACALRSVRTCRLTCHQALKVSRAYWDIRAAHCAGVVATTACTCLGAEC